MESDFKTAFIRRLQSQNAILRQRLNRALAFSKIDGYDGMYQGLYERSQRTLHYYRMLLNERLDDEANGIMSQKSTTENCLEFLSKLNYKNNGIKAFSLDYFHSEKKWRVVFSNPVDFKNERIQPADTPSEAVQNALNFVLLNGDFFKS
jgi:hypothetical protein